MSCILYDLLLTYDYGDPRSRMQAIEFRSFRALCGEFGRTVLTDLCRCLIEACALLISLRGEFGSYDVSWLQIIVS